jgi:glucose/arabinose dehydrogenase
VVARKTAPEGFDIIIDDASHFVDLTKIAFWHLFDNQLKPSGLYVIEDWGTGYWSDWTDGKTYRPRPKLYSGSEHGLLGIAIHPDFPSSPFVYLFYTQSNTSGGSSGSPLPNRVYRYTWNGSALVNPSLILDLPVTPGPNHNGGTMTFGPDGKLYIVIGDLNRDGQLQNLGGRNSFRVPRWDGFSIRFLDGRVTTVG